LAFCPDTAQLGWPVSRVVKYNLIYDFDVENSLRAMPRGREPCRAVTVDRLLTGP
jgi:hypothetical protein